MPDLLHDLLDATARRTPAAPALSRRGEVMEYQELRRRSLALASALAAIGIGPGDRIAVCMQNRPEVVLLALAASRLGAIFVPASPLLRARQLAYLIDHSGARMLVASQTGTHSFEELLTACPSVEHLVLCDRGGRLADMRLRPLAFEELTTGKAEEFAGPARPEDPAAILYTSGSTGRPKGVVVSQRNFVAGALSVSQYLGTAPSDRILAALPLSFDYGFSQVTTALATGACAVLTHFGLPAALTTEVAAERITMLAGVPTMWMHLAGAEWPRPAVESLRCLTNSGGAMPRAVIERLRAALPEARMFCMYGLTEAFRSSYLDPSCIDERPGSIGKAIPGQELFVLRPDGSVCAPGEVGELVHRGSLVTLGYWNDAEATAARFRPLPEHLCANGRPEIAVWSGDLARTDADGFLYFVARGDHMIKSSGYRISPTEIEEIVAEVPGVIESAAVGLLDEALGHRVALAVMVAGDAGRGITERVRQYCREQLPPYMVPAEVHLLGALPRNVNGKCDRAALAQLLGRGGSAAS